MRPRRLTGCMAFIHKAVVPFSRKLDFDLRKNQENPWIAGFSKSLRGFASIAEKWLNSESHAKWRDASRCWKTTLLIEPIRPSSISSTLPDVQVDWDLAPDGFHIWKFDASRNMVVWLNWKSTIEEHGEAWGARRRRALAPPLHAGWQCPRTSKLRAWQ